MIVANITLVCIQMDLNHSMQRRNALNQKLFKLKSSCGPPAAWRVGLDHIINVSNSCVQEQNVWASLMDVEQQHRGSTFWPPGYEKLMSRLRVSPLRFPANWYVNFSWTSVHTPTPPVSLYSCTPTSTPLPLPSEISGEVRTRSALVAALYSVTAAALISPAVSRLASGANITALYWSLLTPHELNMDKHTRQLTGRQWWGGVFAETSGNRFISSQLPIGDFQASREVAANASP